jgi:preprotein translocase subunit SecA
VVESVAAKGEALRGLDKVGLAEKAAALRPALVRDSLRGSAAQEVFALVSLAAEQCLGQTPYPCQIICGWSMLTGCVVEMDTGEGKTLAAALPAAVAALAGEPVHVITANDYLAARDAQMLAPVYEALGLTVGAIGAGLDTGAKREIYGRDIVYASSKQLAFDYLRDHLTLGGRRSKREWSLRRLDPLNPLGGADEGESNLPLLRGLCFAILDEADSVLVDEAGTPLVISRKRSIEATRPALEAALELAQGLDREVHYRVDDQRRTVCLSESGGLALEGMAGDLGGLWSHHQRREELVEQALTALLLFRRDREYIVEEDMVRIVDESTGRVMEDRSWQLGLHQAIEVKEGVPLSAVNESLARLSYQRFFRRYVHLAGMTGTAREVRGELAGVYGLPVIRVPRHRPSQRVSLASRCCENRRDKWQAVAQRVREVTACGRPVLVGTRSVGESEELSAVLTQWELAHQVLNARQDSEEAGIIAAAGQTGVVTVATNMAGRGTDIILGAGVEEKGGLHVILTGRHEARRIDRQLFGRCARQGERGSCEAILSLEDEILERGLGPATTTTLRHLREGGGAGLGRGMIWRLLMTMAQRSLERLQGEARRSCHLTDRRRARAMAFSGKGE